MAASLVLMDSSFLYAITDQSDRFHNPARAYVRDNRVEFMIPDVVLTEVTYSLRKLVGKRAEIAFLAAQASSLTQLVPITHSDLARVHAIMSKYTQFDFVDCCILAIAERLNITHICTFDRRDFQAFIPAHCERLELLP